MTPGALDFFVPDCECGWQMPTGRHYSSCEYAIKAAS